MNINNLLVPVKEKTASHNIFITDAAFIKKWKGRYGEFHRNPDYETSHIKWLTRKRPESDVPVVCNSKEEMYAEMEKSILYSHGYNFTLGMFHEDKYKVWKRQNQPCQGGEMRKYGLTHDDSTRPDDPRPGDLIHPFPDGIPLAVGTNVDKSNFDYFIHPTSPFKRAYTNEDNVM